MIKEIICVSGLAVSAAVAQNGYYSGQQQAPQQPAPMAPGQGYESTGLFLSGTVGTLFDLSEPVYTTNIGFHLNEFSSVSLQFTFFDNSEGYFYDYGYGDWVDDIYDDSYFGIGLAYKAYHPVGPNTQLYFGGSLGAMFVDSKLTWSDSDGYWGRYTGDATTFYMDAVFGLDQKLSHNLHANIGMRLMHVSYYDVDYGSFTIRNDELEPLMFGVEMGLTFRF
ncbi:hypothetical protein [Persicirhabdus sediminis]|uniref:Uncharacterized protein n=1 Tax=Persicirhabdus sediminis TaxID=454144 RepID=A0A8J7MD67_9BACT|nr:hypothetical protein [Persicirhabdus sediminis]MBK1790385.1 hypothetical protein [Persicirhabdus sediminis]